jgi:hypothetical protein
MIRQEYKDAQTGKIVAVEDYVPTAEFRSAVPPPIYRQHACLRCGAAAVYLVGHAECHCGSLYLSLLPD